MFIVLPPGLIGFKSVEKIFQPVDLYFINHLQHFAKLSSWKTFLGKPDHIGFGQADQSAILIPTKWHASVGQFD